MDIYIYVNHPHMLALLGIGFKFKHIEKKHSKKMLQVLYIFTYIWLILGVNVHKYSNHGAYGGFLKWRYPQIIHFKRTVHYKPSILEYTIFWETSIYNQLFLKIIPVAPINNMFLLIIHCPSYWLVIDCPSMLWIYPLSYVHQLFLFIVP